MKICTKCKHEKIEDDFQKDKSRKDGLFPWCKACVCIKSKADYALNKETMLLKNKAYRETNRESITVSRKKYYAINRDELKNKNKKYREDNRVILAEKKKEYHAKNKAKNNKASRIHYLKNREKYIEMERQRYMSNKKNHIEQSKLWAVLNPEKRREISKKYNRKYRETPKGHLSSTISKRINESLKKGMKSGRHWESLVDFTIGQLKTHLEKLFKPGMTWENYGTVWHIDHKMPIAVFDFEKPEDITFKICWSLKNLQPLGASENMSKGGRFNGGVNTALSLGGK